MLAAVGLAVAIAALAAVAGLAATHGPGMRPQAHGPGTRHPAHGPNTPQVTHGPSVDRCQNAFVPAFFSPGAGWTRAISSKPPPSVLILDITSTGAGTAPDPGLQAEVKQAQAAGIKVIGYISTNYGQRPAAQAEVDVRNYLAWYGVTGIFLDLAAEGPAQLGYYRGLAGYIRQLDPGATIWLNPGIYPDQRYLSIADVVMVSEGPYRSYLQQQVPSWAYRYPAAKFAHTIFATPGSQLANAVRLSRSRHAGYVYVTDQAGANPYDGVPSYWSREVAAIGADCAHA
jgi:hypothetical protein